MTRADSCAKAVVCDIAVSGHEETDVGMPAAKRAGLTQSLQTRLQAPGGASRREPPVLAGAHRTEEKLEIIKICDCACIAQRRDAVVTASDADPALLIESPLQSHRAASAMPCLSLVVFVPFACPVTINEIHDTADLPLDRLTIDLVAHLFPRDNLRPPPQMRRYPSHSDETCAKLGVGAARKLRARARIGTALTATQAFRFALSDGAIMGQSEECDVCAMAVRTTA
jgi:hypothetical protein